MISLKEELEAATSQETLEKRLRTASKARELLEVPLFQWWRGSVEAGLKTDLRKLVYSDVETSTIFRRKGIIQGIEQLFKRLDVLSQQVEPLMEQIKEYENVRKL